MTALPPLYQIVLMANRWFAGLPEPVRNELTTRGRRRVLSPGQRLFMRGEESDGIYGVLEGCLRVSGISREGRETVLDFYGPGSWFGEVATLGGLPRGYDAQAYAASSVLQVAPADLEELLAASPALSRALLRLEAQRLQILLSALESYSTQSLEQRLANRLLMLAGYFGVATAEGVEIQLHLPQETLAQLIGATRQRVNQILKAWEVERLVAQQYGRILLFDRERLVALADM